MAVDFSSILNELLGYRGWVSAFCGERGGGVGWLLIGRGGEGFGSLDENNL